MIHVHYFGLVYNLDGHPKCLNDNFDNLLLTFRWVPLFTTMKMTQLDSKLLFCTYSYLFQRCQHELDHSNAFLAYITYIGTFRS